MQKIYTLYILTLSLLFIKNTHAVTVTDTAIATNVNVCLQKELVRLAFSVGGTGTTGSYLEIQLPTGFNWAGIAYGPIVTGGSGSNTMTYAGVQPNGRHRINFGSSTALQSIRLGFYQKADCNAGTTSFTTRDSLFFYEGTGSINISATQLFNGNVPALSITSISNTPALAGVGVNVTRKYNITNGGFGSTSNFIIVDNYLNNALSVNTSSFFINPSGTNYNIPTARINDNSDSIRINFSPAIIQQIGDGDTLFENGESFELEYAILTLNCGDGSNNIISSLHATWLCNANFCTYSNSSTAISITVSSSPNITQINKPAYTWCTNSNSVDTFLVVNSGGTATSLVFEIASQSWPQNQNVGTNSYTGYIDTANFFIKLGKNGSMIHPAISVINYNSMNIYGVNYTNQPAVIRYTRPLLNTGDTLYFFVSQKYFTENLPCTNNNSFGTFRPGYAGILSDLTYKNACGNIDYDFPRNVVRSHEVQQIFYSETSQTDFFCDQAGEIVYKNEGTINQRLALDYFRARSSYYDVSITLPSALIYDNAFTSIQQVRYVKGNGSIEYPYFQPSSNTWRFHSYQLNDAYGGKWVVKVKGAPAASGVCTGVHTYNFTLKTLLDSTNCNPTGNLSTLICNNTNFTYYGCVICCPLGGLAILNSSLERTTLGLPDNNNDRQVDPSGTIDTTLINRRIGIKGDTIRLMLKALAVTNSTHTQWEKATVGAVLPGISSFNNYDYVNSSVKIRYLTAGVDSSYNITSYTILPNDTILFDIGLKRPIVQGDTIIVNANFRDNMTRTSLISHTIPPVYWASHVPSVGGGTVLNNNRFWCGNAIKSYTHHASYNNVYNPGLMQFTGCSQLINYAYILNYVGNVNGSGPNIFRNEFRKVIRPERLVTHFPANYLIDSVNFTYSLAYGAKNIWSVPFTTNNDSVIFSFNSYFTSGALPDADEAADVTIRYYLKPTCKVTSGIQQSTSQNYKARFLPTNELISDYTATQAQLIYTAPAFLLNSSAPIHLGYTKTARWPVTITNASVQTVPNLWAYFINNPNLPIDSVKFGTTLITPDVNGFYKLGTFTGNQAKDYIIYSKNQACNYDSLQIYMGYGCNGYPTSFSSTTCNFSAKSLYIQPQPAAIQTQVSLLTNTPKDPANPSAGNYGSNTIYMCQGFPFEMELQATQPGNLYDVKETLTLPFNGGTGLDYISDSGYIEYPIGTTPRLFSSTANTALLAQVPGGSMILDLAQIDPTNFGGNNSLPGTGLGNNNTRRVKLRWKMKSNCNLVSGDQWQPTQTANSPCNYPADGNNGVTSGFSLDLFGVSKPYVATLKIATGLDGCGAQSTQIRIEKIGAAPPQPTDSITVRIPKTVAAGSVTCSGTACPVGAITYTTRTDALYQYITFPYPSTANSTGDTLLYSFPMVSKNKSTCENNQNVKADVFQQLTIYCGAPIPANLCPNSKSSLGSETKNFDIRKAILNFSGYNSTYVYPSLYKYKFNGNINNTSTFVSAPAGITLKTYMDVNNNLTYEKGIDALVKSTVISSPIATSGAVSFSDSFENNLYPPSPNLPMYTVIDTGDATANCFCGGIVMSAFNQALPVEFFNENATNLQNRNAKVSWNINANSNLIGFNVYRKTTGQPQFIKVGYVKANNSLSGMDLYKYYDPIDMLGNGYILYQIQAIEMNNKNSLSQVVSIVKTGSPDVNIFSIAPNPTNQMVKILLNEGMAGAEIKVFDINGKLMYKNEFKGIDCSIDINNWSNGVYSVVVSSNDWSQTRKLTVIK